MRFYSLTKYVERVRMRREWQIQEFLASARAILGNAYAPTGLRLEPREELAHLEALCAGLREVLRLRTDPVGIKTRD